MIEWFNSFPIVIRCLLVVALMMSIVMVIQIIMLLVGLGSDSSYDGGDQDFDSGDVANDADVTDFFGLRIFTIRNAIAFLAIGGWVTALVYKMSNSEVLAYIIGFVAGVLTAILMAFAMKQISKLQSNGNLNIEKCVGHKAKVYLTIPKKKTGEGKITVLLQDVLCEFSAVTEDEEDIPTGGSVKIIAVKDGEIVVTKNDEQ